MIAIEGATACNGRSETQACDAGSDTRPNIQASQPGPAESGQAVCLPSQARQRRSPQALVIDHRYRAGRNDVALPLSALSTHGSLALSSRRSAINRGRPPDWHFAHSPDNLNLPVDTITGEATPSYVFVPGVADNIMRDCNDTALPNAAMPFARRRSERLWMPRQSPARIVVLQL